MNKTRTGRLTGRLFILSAMLLLLVFSYPTAGGRSHAQTNCRAACFDVYYYCMMQLANEDCYAQWFQCHYSCPEE
jgi:hypothetical protein